MSQLGDHDAVDWLGAALFTTSIWKSPTGGGTDFVFNVSVAVALMEVWVVGL